MKRTRRISMANAVIVCLVASQLSGTLAADELRPEGASSPAAVNVSSELSAPQLFAVTASNVFPIGGQSPPATDALSAPLFAAGSPFTVNQSAGTPLAASPRLWHAAFVALPGESSASFAQYGGYRGRRRGGHHSGAAAAIAVGAVAAVAGTAILVYANRPDCDAIRNAGGCGYGTKVFGGALLAGGVVGLVIAAATW